MAKTQLRPEQLHTAIPRYEGKGTPGHLLAEQMDCEPPARARIKMDQVDWGSMTLYDAYKLLHGIYETTPEVQGPDHPECTGIAAQWCPIHGECICPQDNMVIDYEYNDDCPLHGTLSTHGENSKAALNLQQALSFYADPETYFAIGFFPDPPNGEFMDDFSETELGVKPGKRARIALGIEDEGTQEGT
ncbi:MAG: hypothetical protein GWN58_22810 [Anaerolineae bacterium]|nr:hypothetical protein [Thermoplasmata archaeon]NIV32206.1 hypothetical protein [Anaerolineae bacterium]NIY03658.1 hypothetical protein [Thermoplasmata archaeon]